MRKKKGCKQVEDAVKGEGDTKNLRSPNIISLSSEVQYFVTSFN